MKVLIAEDDSASRRLLQALLERWDYDVVVTSNGAQAWEALQGEEAPRLAILDWMMPGMDGVQVCREVRKRAAGPYIYILLLTAKDQKQETIEGIEAGADDYLTKPLDANELRVRLRSGRRILALEESLIAARDALQFQADHDPLTGLWNSGAILDGLKRELGRSERQGTPFALVMTDLDHFKRINDTYGHLVGDAVLCAAAERMRSCARLYDLVGRYGGEEFLLILPGCDGPSAVKQAERLRTLICTEPFDTPSGNISITLSAGVAVNSVPSDRDPTRLLRAADKALYRAKENGRNRVEFAAGEGPPLTCPLGSAPAVVGTTQEKEFGREMEESRYKEE
jgi:two-component system cell cycle response regulator